ncbi:MAG TPA: hypothetical protein VFM39_08380 [bacterium]|nr:hypothetical protein [bacterium]
MKERRMVMVSGRSSLPLMTEAIAGRHIRGSWMADPEVYRIHGIKRRLTSRDLLAVPLILGKETLVDSSLGPAIARVASDNRGDVLRQLTPLARHLLEQVERTGRVRMDRWGAPTRRARPARLLLERHLLVTSQDIHTERGYHTSIVMPWRASAIATRFAVAARRLTSEKAQDALLLAALRSAVIAPEREARRWFAFGAGRIAALLAQGALQRLMVGGRAWLTRPRA